MKMSSLLACAVFAVSGPVTAADLVTNGGFETGDATGWTIIGNNDTSYNYTGGTNPHSGLAAYRDGNYAFEGYAGLSQQLATTAGAGYDISLWWLATGSNGTESQGYQVLWNGNVIGQINGAQANTAYTNLVYHVFAAGNDVLAFQGFSSSGYNQTDDVSVVANGLSAPVPEPGEWAMMGAGLVVAGAIGRRRRIA